MLRQPLFFVFMISGFFYASELRPLPLAVLGVAATSILINTLIAGLPTTPDGWTFYLMIIGIQTFAIGFGTVVGEKMYEPNEQRRQTVAHLEAALAGERGPARPARRAGPRGGRARRAAADGARDPRHDRAGPDRDRHPARGGRAREATGRRTGAPHRQRAAAGPREPDRGAPVGRGVAGRGARARDACPRRWPRSPDGGRRSTACPSRSPTTGEPVPLHPEIEIALLRTAQEALANVARHAHATRAGVTLSYMGDVVTLDVRDDGVGFEPSTAGDAAAIGRVRPDRDATAGRAGSRARSRSSRSRAAARPSPRGCRRSVAEPTAPAP